MICTSCKEDLLPSPENFYQAKGRSVNPCKRCKNKSSREWYAANSERHRDMTKSWHDRNKERAEAYYSQYRTDNKDKCMASVRDWAARNRRALNEKEKAKIKSDPQFRLLRNVRRAVCGMLTGKQGSSRHLSYTMEELKKHLERQFCDGMNWGNYGAAWHVDHIVPISSFNITGPNCEDFRACWALSNLRPLWADMNLSKGAKETHLI